jgi:hypothetical protein
VRINGANKRMRRARKEKLETYTAASFQIVSENSTEESAVTAADDYTLTALKKEREEADKPLYLKRI